MPVAGEFELIRRFFDRPDKPGRALLGIGDDCALLASPVHGAWAVSTDMLVEGRHFFADVDPNALGHKALAVNLSDLAAMGAQPVAFTLALALPQADEAWLEAFSAGLFELADRTGCELVGGDTTRGPRTLSLTIFGDVPPEQALRRDRARPGDDLWVSGELGGAAWAVADRLESGDTRAHDTITGGADVAPATQRDPMKTANGAPPSETLRRAAWQRLERPEPRVALGLALRGLAHAAIDLSDGLMGDLAHVLQRSAAAAGGASTLGATLRWPRIPRHPVLAALAPERQRALALAGGDDYELLFCAPGTARATIEAVARRLGLALHRIGRIDAEPGIRLLDDHHQPLAFDARSYDHFR
jgi:thiamine-monophosphate kinase